MITYTRLLEFFMENEVKLTEEQLKALHEEFGEDEDFSLEESTIVKNSEFENISFGVYHSSTETNFSKSPYIKVFIGGNPNTSPKLARIDITNMEYVIHYKDSSTQKHWELSSKEKKFLNKKMDEDSKKYKGKSIWDETLITLAKECGKPEDYYSKMFPDGRPDFTKLK